MAIHSTLLPVDFDISSSTLELNINVPNDNNENPVQPQQSKTTKSINTNNSSNVDNNRQVQSFLYSTTDNGNNANNLFEYDTRTIPSKFSLQKYIYDSNEILHHQEPDYVNITLQVKIFGNFIN